MGITITGGVKVPQGKFSVTTSSAATDPNFSDVALLLHMDGSDGGSTFTDNSSFNHTVTANGSSNTSTDQVKFGTASLETNVGVSRS